ncbi:MAG TPA: hypothetical protein VGM77_00885 [Gemmatimonadales bacterium]|jgi:hypothetical protein
MANATERWLPIVSDGQGELIAVADSAGELQGTVTGPEYDAGLWNSSGLTAHSHSFNPARWGVSCGGPIYGPQPPLVRRSKFKPRP